MDTRARTNPFPGLRPFMQEEADLFFGRDKQSDELVRRLASKRFLAVVGTSGSGKSSLVRAGLLPSLEGGFMAEAGAHWRMAILRPQDDPIGFLARAIVETRVLAHLDLAPPAAEGVVETTLRRSSLGLVEAARLARLEPHENLLILVDQFEELFRFADVARQRGAGDEAPAFVKLLLEAARQTEVPVYVVITMRSDFLGDCTRFRDLPETISDSQYLIPRLTRDELQAVITGPIGVRGGRIAPNLVQRLLNDVGDDMDQLPVLQHALMRAWDHWERNDPDTRSIDLNDLREIGGMAEALSWHADEAFRSLTTDRDRKIAERLCKCLSERGPDNREIRRPTQLSRIAAIANADSAEVIRVIDVFRAPGRSFLMPPHDIVLEGDPVIDISHESLIRQWGRLRTWVDEEAESRATYLRVVEAATLYESRKTNLWRDPDLQVALDWRDRNQPNESWAAKYKGSFNSAMAFLYRSREVQNAEKTDAEIERRWLAGWSYLPLALIGVPFIFAQPYIAGWLHDLLDSQSLLTPVPVPVQGMLSHLLAGTPAALGYVPLAPYVKKHFRNKVLANIRIHGNAVAEPGDARGTAADPEVPAVDVHATVYARFVRRALAQLVDWTFCIASALIVFFVLIVLIGVLDGVLDALGAPVYLLRLRTLGKDFFYLALLLYETLFFWLYHALSWLSKHQATPGMRLARIFITDLQGRRLSLRRATARFFSRFLSYYTLGYGFLIQPFNDKRQTLHDRLSGTVVLQRPPKT